MPYTAGSIGPAANNVTLMMAALDPLLVAGGFVFVEQVVNANQTVRVYKSPAASNFFGQDWFLLVRRDADTDSYLYFGVCELYNSTTHLCFNYAPSTGSLVPNAQFAVNDPAGKAPWHTSIYGRYCWVSTGVVCNYWASITPNRVYLSTRYSASDSGVLAGLYQDLLPSAMSPFPLFVGMATPGGSGGGTTREPGQTISNSSNFFIGFPHTAVGMWNTVPGTVDVYLNKIYMSRKVILGRGNGYRGLLLDVLTPYNTLIGVNGDTVSMTVDGVAKTFVMMGSPGSGQASYFVDTSI